MYDSLTRADITSLISSQTGPHLTIYLPTEDARIDSRAAVIRLKNLVSQAQEELEAHWMRSTEARTHVAPVIALLHDDVFWSKQDDGLAIFLANKQLQVFRLGVAFKEQWLVARDFFIRPIVSAFQQQPAGGFLLALSENKAALYSVTSQAIVPLTVPDLPSSLKETLNYSSVDRGQQSHSGGSPQLGKQAVVFHGQGGMSDTHKDELRAYCRAIDTAVSAHLRNAGQPLLLACVDSLVPIYTEVNTYPALHPEHLSGNCDLLKNHELQRRALAVFKTETRRQLDAAAHQIREHLHTSIASTKVDTVLRAAYQGRVQTLLFDEAAVIPGRFDSDLQTPILAPKAAATEFSTYKHDLVELAVVEVLRHGGNVYAATASDIPENAAIAAIFRY